MNKISLLLVLLCALSVFGFVPTNLSVEYRSGQVFISWTKAGTCSRYVIYRSASAFTGAGDLTGHVRVTVDSSIASNPIMKTLSENSGGYEPSGWPGLHPTCFFSRNVLNPLSGDVAGSATQIEATKAMVVLTCHEAGTYYYAVTGIASGTEDKTVNAGAGGNTAGPVQEMVERPQPLLIWQSTPRLARMYLQYTDFDSANSDDYAWPYWVGVARHTDTSDTCRTSIELGGGNQNMAYCSDSLSEWERDFQHIDVMIRPTENWELWFGHSATFDRSTAYLWPYTATSGPVVNYTQARVMDFLQFMLYDEPYYAQRMDTNRINVEGGSNGGCGTLQFWYNYPEVFATASAAHGPSDITQWGETYWTYFGDTADASMHVSFRGWRSEYLKEHFEGQKSGWWFNLDDHLVENPGANLGFLFTMWGGSDGVVPWPTFGKQYIANLEASRRGFCGGMDGPADHNNNGIPAVEQFETIRKNNAYPAFTNVSGNASLPLPNSPQMITYEFNTQFMWSTPYWSVGGYKNQVDQTNRYEIVIASTDGNQTADITLRRLQNFAVQSGEDYIVKNTAVNDTATVYQIDTITADQYGLVTFPGFSVKSGSQGSGGSRLIMVPVMPVSAGEQVVVPQAMFDMVCSPNPFNPVVTISFVGAGFKPTPTKMNPSVRIFQINGKHVTDLEMDNGPVSWDASNQSSDMYLVVARVGTKTLTKRITLVR